MIKYIEQEERWLEEQAHKQFIKNWEKGEEGACHVPSNKQTPTMSKQSDMDQYSEGYLKGFRKAGAMEQASG